MTELVELGMRKGEARMLAHIERGWLERLQSTQLFRYAFEAAGFEDLHDAGMHVSREPVVPALVEPVGDLVEALRAAGVELRLLKRLTPLREVWETTLHASGIRLRNAQDWPARASAVPARPTELMR